MAASIVDQTSAQARCHFFTDLYFGYTCELTDAVTTQRGEILDINRDEHHDRHDDEDVRSIIIGNNTNLAFYPPNLLTIFPNTYYLLLDGSGLTELDPIVGCQSVRILHITQSPLQTIPAGVFNECSNVRIADFSQNNITTIHDDAFEQMPQLFELMMFRNRITRISSRVFRNLTQLQDLYMEYNLIEEIEDGAFANLHELIIFYLRNNRIAEIRPEMFGEEISLVFFSLAENLLTRVPRLPARAPRIKYMILDRNSISEINEGDFTFSYSNITDIELNENLLTRLDSAPFAVLERLDILSVNYNEIQAVDNELFDRIPSLYTFYFEQNNCASVRFNNIRSRDQFEVIDRVLDPCFYEFVEPQVDLQCNFVMMVPPGYTCQVDIMEYVNWRYKFRMVGTHMEGMTNDDVQTVMINSGSILRVPPTIFRTFRNLETLIINDAGMNEIDANTFIECGRITRLDLTRNRIRRLPSTAFQNCEFVEELILDDNQIAEIEPCNFFMLNTYLIRMISMRRNLCVDRRMENTRGGNFLYNLDLFDPFVRQCYGLWYLL